MTTSISSTNTRLAASLPAKIAQRAPGYASSVSIAPCSSSSWYDRLNASTPANITVSHSSPAKASRSIAPSGPSAKPKSMSISIPRNTSAAKLAFTRRSASRSFHAIAPARATSRENATSVDPPVAPRAREHLRFLAWLGPAERQSDDASALQLLDAVSHRQTSRQVVRDDERGAARGARLDQERVHHLGSFGVDAVVRLIEQQELR